MMVLCIPSVVIAILAGIAASQEYGWKPGQVNTTMCTWYNPRAAVIRDTLYIDGGYLWWKPGMADGTYGPLINDGNPLGIVYTLNFSKPFNASANNTDIFIRDYKGPNDQAAASFAPQYYDGFMFSNDDDWLAYGGLLTETASDPNPPSSTAIEGYQQYSDDPTKRPQTGFYKPSLPPGVTRYVTYGGGVSIPAQNQGFYFGGLRAADFGEIFYPTANESINADVPSNTLISVDMSEQQFEKWTNNTIPSTITGRASPELVWIPVANMGVLIAIGGVIYPEYDNINMFDNETQEIQSNITSSGFMSTVDIYDIENGTWYSQETSGTIPPQAAEGCTVVASAADASSHNIYWYGGFDGVDAAHEFYDDVYVLSVPSFTWTKIYSGTPTHGRASHRCVKPYPDQMFVVGGNPSQALAQDFCLEGGILQVFNLSSGQWLESYNPTIWSNYSIPSSVTKVIGGDEKGGATVTSPPTWSNESLATLFASKYSQSQNIKNWYPYAFENATSNPNSTALPSTTVISHGSGGLPSWVAPVLGVVLGLMAITAIIVIFLLWRRRRYLQSHGSEAGASDLNRYRIMSWVRGMPTETGTKAATVTTDDNPESNMSEVGHSKTDIVVAHEAADSQIHEMMDTSRPQELSDTGLTYTNVNMSATPSVASRVSRMTSGASRRFPQSPGTPRAESPSLGNIPPSRTRSGVSSLGSRHRHQVSEIGSVDSASTSQSTALQTPDMGQHQTFLSPISPPTPQNGQEASDYIIHGKDNRKSNFEEDLGE